MANQFIPIFIVAKPIKYQPISYFISLSEMNGVKKNKKYEAPNSVTSFIISILKRNLFSNGFTCMRKLIIASELRDCTNICNGRLKSRYATFKAKISLLKIKSGPKRMANSMSVFTWRYKDMNLGLKSGFSNFAFYFYKNK